MDILKTIYETEYREKIPSTPEFRELLSKDCACWEQTEQAMGAQFTENHWYQRIDIENILRFHDFSQGFHLGFSLAMEALRQENI